MSRTILGTNIANAATASVSVTIGSAVPAGQLVLVAAALENGAGTIPSLTSVTDTPGNTGYSSSFDTGAGTGNTTVCVVLASGIINTPLEASDVITLTIGTTRLRWAVEVSAVNDVLPSGLDKVAPNHNPGSASSLVTGTTLALAQPRELLVSVFGSGVRTYTPGTGWSGGSEVSTTAGTTDRSLFVETRYAEDPVPTTQQGSASVSSASTYTATIASYKAFTLPSSRVVQPRSAVHRAARW